jgi:hypothetical protein
MLLEDIVRPGGHAASQMDQLATWFFSVEDHILSWYQNEHCLLTFLEQPSQD